MSAGAAAVLLAGAAGYLWCGHGCAALRRLAGPAPPRPAAPLGPVVAALGTPAVQRRAPVAAGVAVSMLALQGHVLPAILLAVLSTAALLPARRRASAASRSEAALATQLPAVADLLATGLAAGLAPADALRTVVDASADPTRALLQPVLLALELGLDPAVAWDPLVKRGGPPGRLGRAFLRAAATGAPLAATAAALAEDERDRLRWIAEAAARRAGVRAVGPLAVCFLPAFVLVGVVPLVASVARVALDGLR